MRLSYDLCRCTSKECPYHQVCLRALDMPDKDNRNLIPFADLYNHEKQDGRCIFMIKVDNA